MERPILPIRKIGKAHADERIGSDKQGNSVSEASDEALEMMMAQVN